MFLLYCKPSARVLFSATLSEEFDCVESPFTSTGGLEKPQPMSFVTGKGLQVG